jgi:hypothetical protein
MSKMFLGAARSWENTVEAHVWLDACHPKYTDMCSSRPECSAVQKCASIPGSAGTDDMRMFRGPILLLDTLQRCEPARICRYVRVDLWMCSGSSLCKLGQFQDVGAVMLQDISPEPCFLNHADPARITFEVAVSLDSSI